MPPAPETRGGLHRAGSGRRLVLDVVHEEAVEVVDVPDHLARGLEAPVGLGLGDHRHALHVLDLPAVHQPLQRAGEVRLGDVPPRGAVRTGRLDEAASVALVPQVEPAVLDEEDLEEHHLALKVDAREALHEARHVHERLRVSRRAHAERLVHVAKQRLRACV